MVSYPRWMSTERIIIFAVLQAFGYIVIAVNAAYANETLNTTLFVDYVLIWPQNTIDTFAALNIAVGGLSNIAIGAMVAIDFFRRGAFTSMIIVELCTIGVLDVLWLATGAYTASKWNPVSQFCSEVQKLSGVGNVKTACSCIQASLAFSFLSFSILTIYLAMLLTLALIFWSKGIHVWKKSVRETMLIEVPASAPAAPPAQPAYAMSAAAPVASYAPTQYGQTHHEPTQYEPTQYESTKYESTTYEPTKFGTPSAEAIPSVPYISAAQTPPVTPPPAHTSFRCRMLMGSATRRDISE